eukprot:4993085-Amphidinium_carterae.1
MVDAAEQCEQERRIRVETSTDAKKVQRSALLLLPSMVPAPSVEVGTGKTWNWTVHSCRIVWRACNDELSDGRLKLPTRRAIPAGIPEIPGAAQ